MDLTQQKLTKKEWEFLEVPVNKNEQKILELIYNGYNNVNFTKNETNSLMLYLKSGTDDAHFHHYLYEKYFQEKVKKLVKKYSLNWKIERNKKMTKKLTTASLIRIKNSAKKIESIKGEIIEFILLDIINKFLKKDLCSMYYYSICDIMKNNISYINKYIKNFVYFIIENFKDNINKTKLVKSAYNYIEKNKIIFKYKDIELYQHQKDLFTVLKRQFAKLIYYQAPTGTGKTISPIGIASNKKVIFTCAAKHIGLQLAKSCISMEIPLQC